MLAQTEKPVNDSSPNSVELSSESPIEPNFKHSVVDWLQYEEEHFSVNNPFLQHYQLHSPLPQQRVPQGFFAEMN